MKYYFLIVLALVISLDCFAQSKMQKPNKYFGTENKDSTSVEISNDTIGYFVKQLPIKYEKISDNNYEITYELDGDTTNFNLYLSYIYEDSPETYYISILGILHNIPPDLKPSYTLLKEIAKINFMLQTGALGIFEDNEDNSLSIIYRSQIWLNQAVPDLLSLELYLTHDNIKQYTKYFKPYIYE